MLSLSECIPWMTLGLAESVVIVHYPSCCLISIKIWDMCGDWEEKTSESRKYWARNMC